MADLLKQNKPNSLGCVLEYGISKISQVNIQGGQAPTGGDECIYGGAPILWALNPDGTWESAGGNGVDCQTKGGGRVYEEFAEACYPSQGGGYPIKNPNGSINSLSQ